MSRRKRVLLIMGGLLVLVGIPAGLLYRLRQQDQHERALIVEVTAGNERQVRAELRWGASPNTRDMPDAPTDWREYLKRLFRHQSIPNPQQYTPALLLAERYNHRAIARLLLNAGAAPNATDSTGKYPLMLALEGSPKDPDSDRLDAETALLMLAKGANPHADDGRHNALWAALKPAGRDVARQLILQGADVNGRDESGASILTHADFDLYLTSLLLSRGVNVNSANSFGDTVLMLADERITPLLLARGANVNAKNTDGETALRVAGSRDEALKIRWLLRYGADCRPTHNGGWNLLCWSAAHGHVDLARMALARGIEVNTRDGFRRTPLMFATSHGDAEMVRWLLARGANINAQDKAGMTALMYAAQKDKAAAVQLLLRYGANPRLRDKEHRWTARQRALHFSCENVADLFATGRVPPALPTNTNPNGEASISRIRVDVNRWLVRTPLARKDDPNPDASADFKAYAFRLVDSTGQEGTPVVEHHFERPPAMLAFRDVNGRRYVYIEEHKDMHPGGTIYLAEGLELVSKWNDVSRYGLNCVPLWHGGALIYIYEPAHYKYGWHDPRLRDSLIEVSRFRNGVMKKLGTMDTPGQ